MNKLYTIIFIFSFCFINADEKSLAHRQEAIKNMFTKVEEKLLRLSDKLKEEEPENAKLMVNAFKKAKESLVDLQMKTAIDSLDKNEFENSIQEQEKILAKLMDVLSTLLDENLSVKQEIDKLEKMKAEIEKLISRQDHLARESEKTENKEASIKKIKEAIERLEKAKKRAEDNLENASESRMKGINARSQIARELDSITNEVKSIFKHLNDKDMVENKPETSKDNDDAEFGEPGSREIEKSVSNLKSAEDKILEGDFSKSEGNQKDAIENLSDAIKELSKEINRINELSEDNNLKIAEEQKELKERLRKVQSEMYPGREPEDFEKGSQSDGDGAEGNPQNAENNSPEGESGGEGKPSDSGEPSDGGEPSGGGSGGEGSGEKNEEKPKNAFDQGRKYMHEAEKDLREAKLEKAQKSQKDAVEELKKIKDDINKTLDQLRDEEKEEKLAGLENRFREMLHTQKRIKVDIATMSAKKDAGKFTRMEQAQLNQLTIDETELREKCNKAYDILFEDATSVVFPEIVKQLVNDFGDIANHFSKGEIGDLAQLLIDESIVTLEELIESLVKAQEEMKKEKEAGKQQQSGQNSGKGQPLVSRSNELKLLRRIQSRVNSVTEHYSDKKPREMDPSAFEVYKAQLKRMYERQKDVHSLTKKMNERN